MARLTLPQLVMVANERPPGRERAASAEHIDRIVAALRAKRAREEKAWLGN